LEKKEFSTFSYIKIIILHLILGAFFYFFRPLSIGYSLVIIPLGVFFIIKNNNKNNEALFWAAYIVGAEVFLRMTKGNIGNEYAKYGVIIFMIMGIYYKGISKKAFPFLFFLLFLMPSAIYGVVSLSFDVNIRKALVFNLLGPICLGISSVYLKDKKISFPDIDKLTRWILYPLLAMIVYIFLYNPTVIEVVTGTDSNSATSGGFGPNQVSTVIGLGMFVIFVRLIFFSKSIFLIVFHTLLFFVFSYRGIITFSRGGVYTGIAMIIFLIFFTYFFANVKTKFKLTVISSLMILSGFVIFLYSISQTGGLILNRYKGEDALGREKESKFSGREELAESEMQMFYDNPILGVGVGMNKQYREEMLGIVGASHNEITRMLAEHGLLGVINLLILLIVPIINYFSNKQYIFLISFYLFWFLTINHAAMRIAAPAFIYGLTLLKFSFDEEPVIHRE
jgi:O-antigen ligase